MSADGGDIKALGQRALAGDAEAVRELRRRGVLKGRPGDGLYPASPAQQSLWLWQEQNPDSTLYALPTFLPLPPATAPELVERAVNALRKRHESLRTAFESREGTPWQRVLPFSPLPLPVVEAGDDPQALSRAVGADLERPFDLEAGPLARFLLLRSPGGQTLYLNAHHLVFDGLSQVVLQGEMDALLAAFANGRPSPLPPPRWQYKDFAAWHARLLEGPRGQELRERWRARLAGLEPPQMPTDFPRPSLPSHAGQTLTLALGARTDQAVGELARLAGCTPLTVLAWGVGVILAHHAGQEDIPLGLPCAGRTRPETQDLVGFFVNPVPLRLDLDFNQTVANSLALARQALAETLELQDYPYQRLAQEAQVPRIPGRNPLFDVLVVMQPAPPASALEGAASLSPRARPGSKYDLTFHFQNSPQGLSLALEYSSELFLPERMERLVGQLGHFLCQAARQPQSPLESIGILPEGERRLVSQTFNATARPYPRDADIAQVFAAMARRFADAPALVWGQGESQGSLTYAQLDRQAQAIADALAGPGGARPGDVVGLTLAQGPGMIAALLGVLKAGAAYMPLDPTLPASRLARMLELAGCRLALAPGEDGPALRRAAPGLALLDPAALPSAPPSRTVAVGGQAMAYVLFTSGSTGEPKAVAVPHRGVLRLVLSADYHEFGPRDCMLQSAPLAFDASTLEVWGPLLNGGRLALTDKQDLLSPGGLARAIAQYGVTVLWLTATLCHRLAEDDPAVFVPLRVLLTGGEVVSPRHMRRILEACPHLRLLNGYGPTENSVLTTTHSITLDDTVGPIPIGRPLANTRVCVLDRRGGLAPLGVWGQIAAAGDGLALGYLGRPDLTAEAFVEVPDLSGERLYLTGDLGRWRADGLLEFSGRRDGQVKIRGQRVELDEIEYALTSLPGVREAVVLALEAPDGSAEGRELAAVVRSEAGGPEDWRQGLAAALPAYMIPGRFLAVDQMPVNASGKADRQRLLAMVATSAAPAGSEPPRGAHEQAVAALFAEVLGRPEIGRADNFFHLGGHSLKAARLLARLAKAFGRAPSLRDFMAQPTVAAVAALTGEAAGKLWRDIPPAPEASDYPLSSAQHRLWVLQQLAPDSPAYNVSGALLLQGPLDEVRLAAAMVMVARRHETLGARFLQTAGPPPQVRQVFDQEPGLTLEVVDLQGLADPLAEAHQRMAAASLRPFRLEAEAPARAMLLRLGPERRILFVNLHHIVADGWSVGVLLTDLAACYRADGQAEAAWPPLAVRYRDYAVWQRQRLASQASQADLDFWRQELADPPEPLDLPADRPRPKTKTFAGAGLEFQVPPEVASSLARLAQEAGTGLFAVLASLVLALLLRYTDRRDMVLGVPVAGRDHASLENQVGLFVNTLPLRMRVEPGESFRGLLARVGQAWTKALGHGSCPFDALVDALKLARDPGRNPIFDVMLVLQNAPPGQLDLPGVTASRLTLPVTVSKFDLSFCFEERPQGLSAQLEYASDLFDLERVERLRQHLLTLAASVAAQPDLAVDEQVILPEQERRLVVEGFNATDWPHQIEDTLPGLFARQVARAPHLPAIAPPLGAPGQELSFGELERLSGRLAARLTARGLGPESFVGLCLERCPEMMIAVYGIIRAGAAYVPLDPSLPPARLAQIMEDARAPLVLTQRKFHEMASGLGAEVLVLDDPEPAPPEVLAPPRDPSPGHPAYAIFTSGSTGRPKGVVIEHKSVVNRLLWMQEIFRLTPGDTILQKTPTSFDVSVWELFWWSLVGARLALLAPGAEKDPGAIIEAVERQSVTVMHFVPSMLQAFLSWLESGRGDPRRLACLRLVFASGEALARETAERFNRLLPATELHNLYGPTEAAVDVTWEPCTPQALGKGSGPVPIGQPIHNTQVYVLDQGMRPVPVGVYGEIWLGGVQIARGYLNRPELTAERFVADPFRPGLRLYRTGDRGRWLADGRVEYAGRLDQQIKIRGQRIEPAEVEAALEGCPGVERAVVTAQQGAGGLYTLTAHLVADDGVTPEGLRRVLRQRLPEAMIPERYLALDHLPLTPSGKLDRKALTGRPLAVSGRGQAPPSQTQAQVLQCWRQVLPDRDFDLADNFFDAGGNSLLAIQLHALLDQRWPGRLPLPDLFLHTTVAAQAEALSPALDGPAASQASAAPSAQATGGAVAIIGLGLRLADYQDLESFWQDLRWGADRVGPLPSVRCRDALGLLAASGLDGEPNFGEAAYLDDLARFDFRRFRMSPADAAMLDPEQRLFLQIATACLEDAGYGGQALRGAQVGVFVGAVPGPLYRLALNRCFPERAEQIFALNVPSNLATRLSYLLDWRGPAAVVDTACSSSLNALHLACRALRQGECELALVGGVKTSPAPQRPRTPFAIASSSGRTKAFDDSSDGTGEGEGLLAFLLKPLARALADGDAIHAVILGSAVNQDGSSAGMTAPNPGAQAQVILAAARDAGVSLDSLGYVEAHGTGTNLGDPVEILGLTKAFAEHTQRRSLAAVGSVKGNFGHLDAAAGLLGLAKAVLALQRGLIPPQPFFEHPNRNIDFEAAPVFVPRQVLPWPDQDGPRRAGVSSFGLSGVNCHVILEEPPAAPLQAPAPGWYCLPLSSYDPPSLRALAGDLAEAVAGHPHWPLAAMAHTLTTGREHLVMRLALCVDSREALLRGLIAFAAGLSPQEAGPGVYLGDGEDQPAAPAPPDGDPRDEATARLLAQRYVAGAAPLWLLQAGQPRPARLHLPPTPSRPTRCWPDFPPMAATSPIASGTPWLEANFLDTPAGFLHRLPLEDPGFWALSEHRLLGQPTLAGMALPRLCLEAARLHLPAVHEAGTNSWRLRGLTWLRPLTPASLASGSAQARVTVEGGELSLRLEGRLASGAWAALAEATLTAQAPSQPPAEPLDLAALKAACPLVAPTAQPSARSGPVSVSSRWDCLRQVGASGDGLAHLALLELPPDYHSDLEAPGPHPALLDIAASLGLEEGLVPAACAELRVHAPLPPRLWAWVRRRPAAQGRVVADCVLADDSGRVLLEMDTLIFNRLEAVVLRYPAWRPQPLEPAPDQGLAGVSGAPLLLWSDGPRGQALSEGLREMGRAFIAVEGLGLDPEALAARCRELGVVEMVCAPPASQESAEALAWFLRTLAAGGLIGPLKLLVVGQGGYAVNGYEDFLTPESALLAGLCLVLPQEEPLLTCRYLDADPQASARDILREVAAAPGSPDSLAALRAGVRYQRTLDEMAPAPARAAAFRPEACYVISGGLGGMGLTLAQALSSLPGVGLALLGRHVETPQGQDAESLGRRRLLEALEQSQARLLRLACDVSDRDSLAAALAEVRSQLGPIHGVLHCAGQAGDGFLLRKDRRAFRQVLAPKVAGTRLLHELTQDDPLEVFLLASSLTALTGAPGQSDYTAANAYQDAFAFWRRAQGLPATSLNWPAWRDLGMAARLGAAMGDDEALDPQAAPALVREALASGAAQVALLPRALAAGGLAAAAKPAPQGTGEAQGEQAPEREVRLISRQGRALTASEKAVGRVWGNILGYDELDVDADFYALGGDSISGMRIVNRLNQTLDASISLADLFASASVAALARHLERPSAGTATIQPAPRLPHYALGAAQAGIFKAEAGGQAGTAFNLPQFLLVHGHADPGRLQESFLKLIQRHEILRTRFIEVEGQPRMVVEAEAPFSLEAVSLSETQWQDQAPGLIRPFALDLAPLMRAALMQLDDGRQVLFMDIHHLIADAMTLELLLADLAALYDGAALPEPTLHLKDYTTWEQGFLEQGERQRMLDYWRKVHQAGLPALELPADAPRPAHHTYRGDSLALEMDQGLLQALRAQARRLKTSPYIVMLSAWTVLLSRYCGGRELCFGIADHGRLLPQTEAMAGMFSRVLPLRLFMEPGDTLAELVARVQAANLAALEHRLLEPDRLLQALGFAGSPDRLALNELTFSYMNFPEGDYRQGGLNLEPLGSGVKNSCKGDLAIFVRETPERLALTLEYYADIFERPRMERLSRHFLTLLSALTQAGDDALAAHLPLMDQDEYTLVTQTFNATSLPYPAQDSLAEAFARQARATPQAIALEHGASRLTYAQLNQCSLAMAQGLRQAGARAGEIVGLCMGRSLAAVTAVLGIIRAGGAYLPLDPADPPERLETLARVAGCALIVADQEGRQALAALRIRPLVLDAETLQATAGAEELPPVAGGQAPAYVLFTSGSTGEPKGVEVPHQAVLRLVLSGGLHAPLATDRVLQAAPLGFDASTLEIWGTLLNGARLCLADKEELLAPGGLGRVMASYGITFLFLTTSLCNRVAESEPQCFRQVRLLITGGETLSPPHIRRILEACPDLALINGYGPTENTTFTTATPPLDPRDMDATVTIGRPIANTRVFILDHCDQPAPIGVWGEIAAAGDGLALGYLGRPDLTAAAFVSLPALAGIRLYRTGDLGRWRGDGQIEFQGRRDGQIKIRGYRVEPEEVEAALRQAPGVASAAVVAEGSGEKTRLTACLVVGPGFDPQALTEGLRRRLPTFMVPGRLVAVEAIPLNASGKTDRKLLALMAAQAPELRAEKAFVPPVSEPEQVVARAFAQVFGLERVSLDNDFYDLGGHSLMAARLVAQVAREYGAAIPLGQVFRHPTVRALAALLDGLPRGGQAIPALPPAADHAVSNAQQRLYFLHRMPGGDTAYNMAFVFEFGEDFDPRGLELALKALTARHEGLRTCFSERQGEPRQVIADRVDLPLSSQDLSGQADPRAEALRLARREISTPFDLARAPLFRVRLYDIGDGACLALLVMHHIIGDGWSMHVLFRELSELYAAQRERRTPDLPPLVIQYKDYAAWQLGQDLSAHTAYWRDRLAGAPPRLELPYDRPAAASRSFRGDSLRRDLDQPLTTALFAAARAAGATLANLMLALFASLLYRLTRQEDMVLGLGIAGRNRPEIEGVAGFFVNILPIRLRLDEEMDFDQVLRQTQEVVLGAFDHQDYPFDLLVRQVAPQRAANRQPLANVVFEYQDFSPLDTQGPPAASALVSRPFDAREMQALEAGTAKYDLTMFVLSQPGDQLQLRLEYDSDLFDAQTASAWLDYLASFAQALVARQADGPPPDREAAPPAPALAKVLP